MNARFAMIFAVPYHTTAAKRPLGITFLEGKIVQLVVWTVLSAVQEEDFLEINY